MTPLGWKIRVLIGMLAQLLANGALAHPQDGPHTDFRIIVTDREVKISHGINLAFIDLIAPTRREIPEALAPSEGQAVLDGLMNHLRTQCPVTINGQVVDPIVDSLELFDQPDAAMIPLFPKSGMRGLIRVMAQLRYPVPSDATDGPERVSLTWDGYPLDTVSGEVGDDGLPPNMTIEAQLRAEGKLQLIRFSETKPTIEWVASSVIEDPFASIPPVPSAAGVVATLPMLSLASGAVALVGGLISLVLLARGKTPVFPGVVTGAAIVAAGLTLEVRTPVPGTTSEAPALTAIEQQAVFEPLHENLYRAFDYADASDVYDALERSVEGDLLETMYRQIFNSLVQAEEGGMLGIVTGLEPGELEFREAVTDLPPHSFTARHVWQVEGTLYHWGHSHSRVNEYEAEFDIAPVAQAAAASEGDSDATQDELEWRIVAQRVLRQTRVDDPEAVLSPEQSPAAPVGEI